jgi:hypothetical protein
MSYAHLLAGFLALMFLSRNHLPTLAGCAVLSSDAVSSDFFYQSSFLDG